VDQAILEREQTSSGLGVARSGNARREATRVWKIDRFHAGFAEWRAGCARHAFRATNLGPRDRYFGYPDEVSPVGDGVEVLGQRHVLEGHDLLVERVGGGREGVVGGGAAAEEDERIAGVLAEVGVGGNGGGAGGEGTEEAEVVVVEGGGRAAAAAAEEQPGEEEVPHRSAVRCGSDCESVVVSGLAAPAWRGYGGGKRVVA
jgi:hypothetical protein